MVLNNFNNNTQNVHSPLIQQSVKKSIIDLVAELKEPFYYNYSNDSIFTVKTKNMLNYYDDDDAYVHYETGFTFNKIFNAIMYEINKFTLGTQIEIKKRLNEEILNSEHECFTGRLLRVINSLSGYSNKVRITMSSSEEIGNIIILMKSKFKSIDDIKTNVEKELRERNYDDEIISEWTSYID